ncbi:spermatogenesis-defective protein 39 [Balamuthia mandrillaris]
MLKRWSTQVGSGKLAQSKERRSVKDLFSSGKRISAVRTDDEGDASDHSSSSSSKDNNNHERGPPQETRSGTWRRVRRVRPATTTFLSSLSDVEDLEERSTLPQPPPPQHHLAKAATVTATATVSSRGGGGSGGGRSSNGGAVGRLSLPPVQVARLSFHAPSSEEEVEVEAREEEEEEGEEGCKGHAAYPSPYLSSPTSVVSLSSSSSSSPPSTSRASATSFSSIPAAPHNHHHDKRSPRTTEKEEERTRSSSHHSSSNNGSASSSNDRHVGVAGQWPSFVSSAFSASALQQQQLDSIDNDDESVAMLSKLLRSSFFLLSWFPFSLLIICFSIVLLYAVSEIQKCNQHAGERDQYKRKAIEMEAKFQSGLEEKEVLVANLNQQMNQEAILVEQNKALQQEFDGLKAIYVETISKLNKLSSSTGVGSDGGGGMEVLAIVEENEKLKENIQVLKRQQMTREDEVKSLREIIAFFQEDLKSALEEKVMLIEELNRKLETEDELERENTRLKHKEKELSDSLRHQLSPQHVVNQLQTGASCLQMHSFTSLADKIELLDAGIETGDPHVIMSLLLFLRNTLSQPLFFNIITTRPEVLGLYINHYARQSLDSQMELMALYRHLERPVDHGLLMLRHALAIKHPYTRVNALLSCIRFFQKQESLAWFGDELQRRLHSGDITGLSSTLLPLPLSSPTPTLSSLSSPIVIEERKEEGKGREDARTKNSKDQNDTRPQSSSSSSVGTRLSKPPSFASLPSALFAVEQ